MSTGEPTQRLPRAPLPARYRDPVLIGSGGMGQVYRAEDAELGRVVAVKVLAEGLAGQDDFRRRFRREAISAARIAHPHVATVYDVGEHDGRPYIVMELLPGGTLADRVAGRPPPAEAVAWIAQAASALDAAHARGVVHRDVKPANLLLDASGNLKVADFGIARVLEDGGSTVTAAGTVLGTAGYLAPEQARAEPATRATDVYSLAAVAYELLTGRRPFDGRATAAEMAAHLYEPVPPASGRDPALPVTVDRVLERGLAKDPEDRHPSAGAFADDLAAALGPALAVPAGRPGPRTEPAPAPPEPAPRRVAARARRRRLAPVLAPLAVLLAGAGIGAAVLTGGDPSPEGRAGGAATTAARTTVATPAEPDGRAGPDRLADARAQVDRATARLSEGDPAGALPPAMAALEALRDTGHPYEGNAGYNVGRSLVDLGRCEEAVPFLEAAAGTGSGSQNAVRAAALEEARACAGGGEAEDEADEGGGGDARDGEEEGGGGGVRDAEDGSGAPPAPPDDIDSAIALTDRSTARMRAGDPAGALSLAALALEVLSGTGHRYEGNASFNAGRSLVDLGRCEEAMPLLQRSLDLRTGTKDERRIRREALREARRCR